MDALIVSVYFTLAVVFCHILNASAAAARAASVSLESMSGTEPMGFPLAGFRHSNNLPELAGTQAPFMYEVFSGCSNSEEDIFRIDVTPANCGAFLLLICEC